MAFKDDTQNSWVDVFTDSQALVKAWKHQRARSPNFLVSLRKLFSIVCKLNIDLHLFHIRSKDNPADMPSRRLSLQDAKLSTKCWDLVQAQYGEVHGHSVDLMAVPSNCQSNLKGAALPFFSPYPTPGNAGVNIFAQSFDKRISHLFSNPYVFPPICLIAQVLHFLKALGVPFTMVVPDVHPRKFWWPVICAASESRFLLASRGSSGALLVPSNQGYRDDCSLPWDLWVFRVSPS